MFIVAIDRERALTWISAGLINFKSEVFHWLHRPVVTSQQHLGFVGYAVDKTFDCGAAKGSLTRV